jgi:hypothetical protein
MKDEEAIDWRERFPTFHWTRRTSSRRGDRKLIKKKWYLVCVFWKEKEENECAWNF